MTSQGQTSVVTAAFEGEMVHGKETGPASIEIFDPETGKPTVAVAGHEVDDELEGFATIVVVGQSRFDGEFHKGRREGHGVKVWNNGGSYDGNYRNGLPDGFGTFVRGSQRFSGAWHQGCFIANGACLN